MFTVIVQKDEGILSILQVPKEKYGSKTSPNCCIYYLFFASQFKKYIIAYYSYTVTKVFKNWDRMRAELNFFFF